MRLSKRRVDQWGSGHAGTSPSPDLGVYREALGVMEPEALKTIDRALQSEHISVAMRAAQDILDRLGSLESIARRYATAQMAQRPSASHKYAFVMYATTTAISKM